MEIYTRVDKLCIYSTLLQLKVRREIRILCNGIFLGFGLIFGNPAIREPGVLCIELREELCGVYTSYIVILIGANIMFFLFRSGLPVSFFFSLC